MRDQVWGDIYVQEEWDDEQEWDHESENLYWNHPDVVQMREEHDAIFRDGRYQDLPGHYLKYSGWYVCLPNEKVYTIYRPDITEEQATAYAIGQLQERLKRLTLNLRRMQSLAREHKVENMDEEDRYWFFRRKSNRGWAPLGDTYGRPNEHKIFSYPLDLLNVRRLKNHKP